MRLALLAALALTAACRPRVAPPRDERSQFIEDLTLSQSALGVPAWTLRSRLARLHEEEKTANLEAPVMEFYREGKAVSKVTSRTGDIATDTHDVLLSSSVVLTSYEDHSVLTTDAMVYSSKTKLFRTDSDVVIHRPEGVIYGRGMEATPDLSEIRIFKQRSVMSAKAR